MVVLIHWWLYLSDYTEHYTEFYNNAGFNTWFNPKVKSDTGVWDYAQSNAASQQIGLKLDIILGFRLKLIWALTYIGILHSD